MCLKGDTMNINPRIKKTIYPPNTVASGCSKWYAELREDGLLMRDGYFDTEEQAQNWLKDQKKTAMSSQVVHRYIDMFKRWKYK